MKMRVALLCGAVVLGCTGAQADEVDDLLSGKSIGSIQETTVAPTSEPLPELGAPTRDVLRPTETAQDVDDHPAWRAGVPAELPPNTVSAATTHATSPLSLVPEPSAIALAGLALVYFLVFFHRRRLVA